MLSVEKTLKQEIEQWKHEYEVLDACCELAQGKIAELKAENDKLNKILQEIKAIAEQCMNKDTCYDCEYFDDCYIEDAEIPTYDICKLLIQKITKAEEK